MEELLGRMKQNHGWWPIIVSKHIIRSMKLQICDQTFKIRLPNNERIEIDMVKWSRDRNCYAQDVGYWNAARIQCTVRNPKTMVGFDATFCRVFRILFWIRWASWTFCFELTPGKLPTFENLGTLYPRYPYNDCHTLSRKSDTWPLLLKRPRFFSTLLNVFVFSNDELRDPAELVTILQRLRMLKVLVDCSGSLKKLFRQRTPENSSEGLRVLS